MPQLEDLDSDEPLPRRIRRHQFDRLIMLSDGVFAIAITLAALELHPQGAWTSTAELWRAMAAPLGSYVVSFLVIAAYWLAHRDTFSRLRRVDAGVTWLTLSLLFFVALLPAGTQLLWGRADTSGMQVYGCCVIACGLSTSFLWAYASLRPGLMLPGTPMAYRWVRFVSGLMIPAFFGWLVLQGAGARGPQLFVGAGIATTVMALMRRFILPRLAGDAKA